MYPIYDPSNMPKVKPGLYLGLFHGARTIQERQALGDSGEWGTPGPLIGPLEQVHTTYGQTIKFSFEEGANYRQYPGLMDDNLLDIPGKDDGDIESDCIRFAGVNYGDWVVFYIKE